MPLWSMCLDAVKPSAVAAIEADGRKGYDKPKGVWAPCCGYTGDVRLAATGARALGLSDCLNYGSPENPASMWQMVEGIEGIAEAGANALEVPVVSGNVSLYNETDGTAVLPTLIAFVGAHAGEQGERFP